MDTRSTCIVLSVFFAAAPTIAAPPIIARDALAKAKRATVLVTSNYHQPRGTACCIDQHGFFVTTARVVGQLSELKLILDSGELTQQVVTAKVVQKNEQTGLALLVVKSKQDIPALELAAADGLKDADDVIVLGFPNVDPNIVRSKSFPNISVKLMTISVPDAPARPQFDTQLASGVGGGPVVDLQGRLVAIATAETTEPQGSAQAISVATIQALLREPQMEILKIGSTQDLLDGRFEVDFSVQPVGPTANRNPQPEVFLRLGQHKVKATAQRVEDFHFHADIQLPDEMKIVSTVNISARYENGSVSGRLENAQLQLPDWNCRLGEVVAIRRKKDHYEVQCPGGPHTVAHLPAVALRVNLGSQAVELPLAKVLQLEAKVVDPTPRGALEIVVRDQGKVIGTLEQRIGGRLRLEIADTLGGLPVYSTSHVVHGRRLVELRRIPTPVRPRNVAFVPAYDRLVFLDAQGYALALSAIDGQLMLTRRPRYEFTDLVVCPNGRHVLITDSAGEDQKNRRSHHLFRLDLETRSWEEALAPKFAGRIQAVSEELFLLQSLTGEVDLTLNLWRRDEILVRELARTKAGHRGDFCYQPFSQYAIYGNSGQETSSATSFRVSRDSLTHLQTATPHRGTASGQVSLSSDGRYFFHDHDQYDASDLTKPIVRNYVEQILAATADLALTATGYYDSDTGTRLGRWPKPVLMATVSVCGDQVAIVLENETILYQVAP